MRFLDARERRRTGGSFEAAVQTNAVCAQNIPNKFASRLIKRVSFFVTNNLICRPKYDETVDSKIEKICIMRVCIHTRDVQSVDEREEEEEEEEEEDDTKTR